jgi:hypothetical protein
MKRTNVLHNPCPGSLLLLLALIFLAGCSGENASARATGSHGLERSEFIALKKAAKNSAEFKDALLKKKIEKLQEKGVVVETTTSGKTRKRDR